MAMRNFRRTVMAAATVSLATLAQPALALNVDGLLEAGEYANQYSVQMPGQTGASDLYFTDNGVDLVNFYFRFSIDAVDNTYGINADPAYPNHQFSHLVTSDNLTLEFSAGTITLDYLSSNGNNGQGGTEYQTCGTLPSSDCATSGIWDSTPSQVYNPDGSASGIDVGAVVVETSLDYNLNHADGFVNNATANGATAGQRFDAVTGGSNSGDSPTAGSSGALADPNNLWLTYVGYEFSVTRAALNLSGNETFDISMLTSMSTHISPPKSGPETSTCVVANGCTTEITTEDPPDDVPAPASIVLLGTALLLGARGMRRARRAA